MDAIISPKRKTRAIDANILFIPPLNKKAILLETKEGRPMKRRKMINTFPLVMIFSLLIILPPLDQVRGADFFAKPELGGINCTLPDPCYFVTAMNSAHDGDIVYFREGTYIDHNLFPHVLYVTRSVTLLGGWDGSPSGPLVRDPEMHPSILDGENLRRGIYINGNVTPISPTIDGFTITNGNASNLATNCSAPNAKGCGGGIFVYRAGVRIINNKILNNKAHAIANQSGSGGGIHLEEASGAVIRGNLIQGNQANPIGGDGGGGGLSIYGVTQDPPNVNKNRFINNSAPVGGGITTSIQTHPVVQDNFFDNNSALQAAGLAVFTDGTIAKNHFQNHQGQETVFLAVFQGVFDGNTIVSNNTNTGLRMVYGSPPFPRISNNIIAGSGTNAILAGGAQQSPLFADLEHNTLVGGGGGRASASRRTTM